MRGKGRARATAADILAHLRRIVHVIHARSAVIERAMAVTGPQLWALREVASQHDGISLGELAARLVLHKANAGRLADRLASQGFVRRETPPTDRRVVLVRPTPAGRRLAERAVASPIQADLLARLQGLPPGELEPIERAFQRVVALLGAETARAGPLFDAWTTRDKRTRRPRA